MEGLGVTAVRVCELMLLTLENEKQTWPERIEGCMGGRRGESKKKRKGSSEDRDGDSCPVAVIKTHKANEGWMMGHMCLFEYSSQVEDVSGGQALRDRTGLIFGVWMSQQVTVDLMYLQCCGMKPESCFWSRSITRSTPGLSTFVELVLTAVARLKRTISPQHSHLMKG